MSVENGLNNVFGGFPDRIIGLLGRCWYEQTRFRQSPKGRVCAVLRLSDITGSSGVDQMEKTGS